MKIETKKQEFQPVVITLETQDEVDQMFALANFNKFNSLADITSKLIQLDEAPSNVGRYWKPVGKNVYNVVTFG